MVWVSFELLDWLETIRESSNLAFEKAKGKWTMTPENRITETGIATNGMEKELWS